MLRRTALALPFLATVAHAQAWRPARPVRLVIAFPPGGSTDVLGRLIAAPMTAGLGQPVVPENRSGAAGSIGSAYVAQSAPDGLTLLLDSGGHAVNPYIMRGLPFDYATAFAPVTLLATLPLVLVVAADSGIDSLEALRARAANATYGSVGVGSRTHLAGALLLRRWALSGTHVPYRGGADQITAQLRGETTFGFSSIALTAGLIREGKLRALGVSSPGVASQLPGVAPLAEQGLSGFSMMDWLALHAPAGTPAPVVAAHAEAASAAMAEPAIQPRLSDMGLLPEAHGPTHLARFLAEERAAMSQLVEAEGIRLD
ncbi:Bug family tripartite tricarboxylate transporter substrate binding protein [Rhodovarius crocodyli]|nr:tripartite tricarboxylate transporter substrate-binding protein [Rhodovarius crocodyli]